MISHNLTCKVINGQTHVLVPLTTLLSLLGADTPVKQLALPNGAAPSVVIVPPIAKNEAMLMDADLEAYRQSGSPSFGWDYSKVEGD